VKYAVPVVLALTLGVACNRTETKAAETQAPAPGAAAQPGTPVAPGTPAAPGTPGAPEAAPPAAPPAKPVPAVLPAVVARVNGVAIASAELEKAIRNLEANVGNQIPAERRNEVYRGILDQLVEMRLLEQEAAARNIKATDAEVAQGIDEMKKQAPNAEAFAKALASRKMTEADLRAEARQRLAVDKLLTAEVEPKAAVTDADIADFYKKNPQFFMQPEAMRASHILLKADTPEAKTAARAKAQDLLTQIKGGADFAALAKQHSNDGSAASGGDLGFFPRGQMVKAFEDAAFALKPGEVSPIVESEFGYHIIKAAEHRDARTVPLAEVSDRIAQALRQQKQQQLAQEYVQSLKTRGKVEILM
jgi:peptidyl-prolyl cis-trans isomerase C